MKNFIFARYMLIFTVCIFTFNSFAADADFCVFKKNHKNLIKKIKNNQFDFNSNSEFFQTLCSLAENMKDALESNLNLEPLESLLIKLHTINAPYKNIPYNKKLWKNNKETTYNVIIRTFLSESLNEKLNPKTMANKLQALESAKRLNFDAYKMLTKTVQHKFQEGIKFAIYNNALVDPKMLDQARMFAKKEGTENLELFNNTWKEITEEKESLLRKNFAGFDDQPHKPLKKAKKNKKKRKEVRPDVESKEPAYLYTLGQVIADLAKSSDYNWFLQNKNKLNTDRDKYPDGILTEGEISRLVNLQIKLADIFELASKEDIQAELKNKLKILDLYKNNIDKIINQNKLAIEKDENLLATTLSQIEPLSKSVNYTWYLENRDKSPQELISTSLEEIIFIRDRCLTVIGLEDEPKYHPRAIVEITPLKNTLQELQAIIAFNYEWKENNNKTLEKIYKLENYKWFINISQRLKSDLSSLLFFQEIKELYTKIENILIEDITLKDIYHPDLRNQFAEIDINRALLKQLVKNNFAVIKNEKELLFNIKHNIQLENSSTVKVPGNFLEDHKGESKEIINNIFTDRLRNIATLKTNFLGVYLFLAKQRLGKNWLKKIIKMEKNLAPLSMSKEDYENFTSELSITFNKFFTLIDNFTAEAKSLSNKNNIPIPAELLLLEQRLKNKFFASLILGSSVTFFSAHPNKGFIDDRIFDKKLLLENPDLYISLLNSIKTYDDKSDMDTKIFSPAIISFLAYFKHHNNIARDMENIYFPGANSNPTVLILKKYWDPLLDHRFDASRKNLADFFEIIKAFQEKWAKKIGDIELNLSKGPDYFRGNLSDAGGERDLEEIKADPYDRFVHYFTM